MKLKKAAAACVLALLILAEGCGISTVNWKPGRDILITDGQHELSDEEVRLIALQYKTEYDRYYADLLGEGFWDTVLEEGMTYADFIKEYCVFRECKALFYLNTLAEEQNYSLSILDEEKIREAADAVYASMSEDEKTYTGADADTVYSVLRYYYIAAEMVSGLVAGTRLEISEEESRVADIQVIRLKDEETAQDLLKRIGAGESFSTLARENTIDQTISYSVAKGELIDKLDELIFAMKDGEISNIVSFNDSFYIFRMANSYNTILSANHKRNLLANLKFSDWEQVYSEYESALNIKRNQVLWGRILMNGTGDFPEINLFQIFNN